MMWNWFGIGFSLTLGVATALLIAGALIVAVMLVIAIIMAVYEYTKGRKLNGNRL